MGSVHPLMWLNLLAILASIPLLLNLFGGVMFTSVRNWIARWQEPVVWLPLTLLIALVAYYLIPAIAPGAGIDGWGDVWAMLPVTVGIMLAAFLAWLIARTYHLEMTDEDERELIDHAAGIDRTPEGKRFGAGLMSWPAVVVWLVNRLFFLALFALCLRLLVPR